MLPGQVVLDRVFERVEVVAAVGAGDRVPRGEQAEPTPERRLVDHLRDLVRRPDLGQIHEHPRNGRDGDAVVRRPVARVDGRLVKADARG